MARLRVTYESSHAALAEEEAEAEMRAQVRSRRQKTEEVAVWRWPDGQAAVVAYPLSPMSYVYESESECECHYLFLARQLIIAMTNTTLAMTM